MCRKKSCSHRHLKDGSKLAKRGYGMGKRPLEQGKQTQRKRQKFPVAGLEREWPMMQVLRRPCCGV